MKTASWPLVLLVLASASVSPAQGPAPVYPQPQRWHKGDGAFDAKGCSIFLPADPGPQSLAVAEALSQRLKLVSGLDLPVRAGGDGPKDRLLLSVGREAPDWKQAAGKCDLSPVPAAAAGEGYALRIEPDGASMASKSGRGLSYAAVTLIQLARSTKGGPWAAIRITDWPDLPVRGFHGTHVFRSQTVSADAINTASACAALAKEPMLVLELDTGIFRMDGHPEFHRPDSVAKAAYVRIARRPLADGVEVVPWVQMGKNITLRFGCPYAPLSESGQTYQWAFQTVADEMLEVFLPRSFHLGMNEDWHYKFGPWNRDREQWREAFVRFADYLRRKGVSAMAVADYLNGPTGSGYGGSWADRIKAHGLGFRPAPPEVAAREVELQGSDQAPLALDKIFRYPAKPNASMSDEEYARRLKALQDEYADYVGGYPADLILAPKFSTTRGTAAENMSRFGHRVILFCPYVTSSGRGDNGFYGAHAARLLRDREGRANVLGCFAGNFAGGFYSLGGIDPRNCTRSAGIYWNVASVAGATDRPERNFPAPLKEEIDRPLNWRILIDAEPRGGPDEVVARVLDARADVWLAGREEAVALGLAAVPALLKAMKLAAGEPRQRLEGCISRIGRDGRNGIDRGKLDIGAVEGCLSDAAADLRNIAAEAIAAAGPEGRKRLLAGLKSPGEAAACARALAYARGAECAQGLAELLGRADFSAETRANAAGALGLLKDPSAAGPLARMLESEPDPAAQREAAWALALLDGRDKDKAISPLLSSPDKATRCRAILALAVLRSGELLKVGPLLAGPDADEAWLATWALFPAHVFDDHIASNRTSRSRGRGGAQGPRFYSEAQAYYPKTYSVYDIEQAVGRDEAVKLIAAAAPKQPQPRLKALMQTILKDPARPAWMQPRPTPQPSRG